MKRDSALSIVKALAVYPNQYNESMGEFMRRIGRLENRARRYLKTLKKAKR